MLTGTQHLLRIPNMAPLPTYLCFAPCMSLLNVKIIFPLVLENSLGWSGLEVATAVLFCFQIASRNSHNACDISHAYFTILLTKHGIDSALP
jgi:hypothetical protein